MGTMAPLFFSPVARPGRPGRPLRRCVLVGAALLLAAAPARADEGEGAITDAELGVRSPPTAKEKAAGRKHYKKAQRFYQDGLYEASLAEMTEAYRLSQFPDLLYNLAVVSEKLGHNKDALRFLERYLLDKPNAQDAEKVRGDIDRLKESLRPPPPPEPVKPPPPPVRVERDPDLDLARRPPPPPPARAPWGAIGVMGGGVALLITGIGLGGGAMAAANEFVTVGRTQTGQAFSQQLYDIQQRGKALTAAGIALDVIGGVAIAGGLAWTGVWLYQRRAHKDSADKVGAALRPAGAGLVLDGRF